MKKLLLLFTVILFVNVTMGNDVLTLLNKADGTASMRFSGEIKKIKNCEVVFKSEGKKYIIPSSEIYSLEFEKEDNNILRQFYQTHGSDNCLKGVSDAELYHKSGGAFALGILFGPFAIIGTAVTNPSPMRGQNAYMSQNKELFNDSSYLSCYSRSARQKNTKNAALGWLSWIVLVLVAASSTS
ncbi:MAG: hypothetical protein AB2L24_05725 [Mangrovibacterium sp.]